MVVCGLFCQLGMWLFLASYLEMPVSTTHSCVGGMIGMALVLGGSDCVIWYKPVETFPYVGGVGGIVMSWFLSPLFSAMIAMSIFFLTRAYVLRHEFTKYRLNWVYPILIGSTITINTFFIIYKGAKGLGLHKTPLGVAFAVAFGAGRSKRYYYSTYGTKNQNLRIKKIRRSRRSRHR